MKKLANIDIGLCGEYYVCAQMHLKGWTASMTLKNLSWYRHPRV